MNLIHICNPENRRAQFVRQACATLKIPPPREISWLDFLEEKVPLEFQTSDLVRIESPGENFAVERLLIEKGGGPTDLIEDHGRLRNQTAWYGGWTKSLEEILLAAIRRIPTPQVEELGRHNGAAFVNHPHDIALMFDKYSAQIHLTNHGIPIPELLGRINSYDQLIHLMEERSIQRVFLKPSHSSSASGVVAFQTNGKDRMLATTSADVTLNSNIYNSLRLRHYRSPDQIRRLVDLLASENLMAERWFPKASHLGKTFDLRVLVIAGKARHVVMRTSSSPITNLHLGNARGNVADLRETLGETTWGEAMKVCEATGAAFPNSHYIAVDLMISASHETFAVAEVNAFGDLIPNIFSDGDDTYTAEFRSLL